MKTIILNFLDSAYDRISKFLFDQDVKCRP